MSYIITTTCFNVCLLYFDAVQNTIITLMLRYKITLNNYEKKAYSILLGAVTYSVQP